MNEKEIIIHPLVLVNISDHLHRARINKIYPLCKTPEVIKALQSFKPPPEQDLPPTAGTKTDPRVMGALLGTVASGSAEFFTSFEFPYEICPKTQKILIDFKYLNKKSAERWYSTGSDIYSSDSTLQEQLSEHISNPIYLLFPNSLENPSVSDTTGSNTLALRFFETKFSSAGSKLVEFFGYKVQFGEAERVGVTEMHKFTQQLEPYDFISDHLKSLLHSVSMFSNRLTIIRNYLKRDPKHQTLSDLRRIRSVCLQLKSLSNTSSDPSTTISNALHSNNLVEYLASLTSNISALSALLNNYSTLFNSYIADVVPKSLIVPIGSMSAGNTNSGGNSNGSSSTFQSENLLGSIPLDMNG